MADSDSDLYKGPPFTRFPTEIFDVLLCSDLSQREQKVMYLICRLAYGCQLDEAKIFNCDFGAVGISQSHIKKVINSLIDKELIIFDSEKHLFSVNRNYIVSILREKNLKQLKKLTRSIHINLKRLPKKQLVPKVVTDNNQNGKFNYYQIGNSAKGISPRVGGTSSLKDILNKDSYINDKENIIADNKFSLKDQTPGSEEIPKGFVPKNEEESAAYEVLLKIEPQNLSKSLPYYIKAARELGPDVIYEVSSEILQGSPAKNPGALFVSKIQTLRGKKNVE